MNEFLNIVRNFAYAESERTGMPLKQHIDLSCMKAKELARQLGGNEDVVEAGALAMDCVIGTAIQQGKVSDHIQMCLEKSTELLAESNLSDEVKENIRHCVLEHHGSNKFYSIESEICCNADCYRFASIPGFFFTVRFLRDMPLEDFIKLLRTKFNEKRAALTMDICKKELEDDLRIIEEFISKIQS